MKILIVAGYFPPHAPGAATRINKLSRYLLDRGCDVHVLTIGNLPFPSILPPEIPAERITYTKYVDVKNLPETLIAKCLGLRGRNEKPGHGNPPPAANPDPQSPHERKTGSGFGSTIKKLLRPLRDVYFELVTWPDSLVGWLPYGTRAGLDLITRHRPDLVYASGPPHSTLLLARRLSKKTGVPWIGELRDLWTDDPYYDNAAWRKWFECRQEASVIRDASALVVVTEPSRTRLREKYGKPTALVMNGFDPRDYPENPAEPAAGPEVLSIVYTGALYTGKRDPEPLFAAIAGLGDQGKPVKVKFYGPKLLFVEQLAKRYGLEDNIELNDPISYTEVVQVQRRADILLLLRWDDPGEQAVIPGKLFEYLGARRPILSVGLEEGVAADIIREREAGIVTRSPETIAGHLRRWIEEKKTRGLIAPLPVQVRDGMSRSDQFALLETFLEQQVGAESRKDPIRTG